MYRKSCLSHLNLFENWHVPELQLSIILSGDLLIILTSIPQAFAEFATRDDALMVSAYSVKHLMRHVLLTGLPGLVPAALHTGHLLPYLKPRNSHLSVCCVQALSKNGKYLGDRYVRLLHVPKQEMEEQVRLGTLAIPGAHVKMRQKMTCGPGMDGGMRGGAGPYSADGLRRMMPTGPQGLQEISGYGALPVVMPGMHPAMSQHSMQPPGQPGMGIGMSPSGMHSSVFPGSMALPEQQQQPLQTSNPPPG